MAYTTQFQKLMDKDGFPKDGYKIYPITDKPDIQVSSGKRRFSWIVAMEPAPEVPNDSYFQHAGAQNGVGIEKLIGVHGGVATFYRLVSRSESERDRQRLDRTIAHMAILANVWDDTVATAEVLTQHRGYVETDLW